MIVLLLLPFFAALLLPLFSGEKGWSFLSIAATGLTFLGILVLSGQCSGVIFYPGIGLSFTLDGFSRLYGTVVCFMWFGAALLSPQYFHGHHHLKRYYFFFLFVETATLGVFLAADLYTLFLFFELMSLGSYVWVVQEETPDAISAGRTYLTIAVLGGLVTLLGMILLYHLTGTLAIHDLAQACAAATNQKALWWASLCLFFGFAAKAGAFPLHIWLPKAHPVAPAPASALLSGVLTKTGILGALLITSRILPGFENWGNLLLILGAITMVLGAGMALCSNHLKSILACSSLSQIGFILTGVSMLSLLGKHGALAANGVILYMVNHSLVKLTLFLLAGVVYLNCHALDLNDIRGFGRGKPWLFGVFLCGACSLAGIPGFCGYLSKTLVHEAIVEYAQISQRPFITVVEWLFLFSGGLTAAYLTKIGAALFTGGEKKSDHWGTPLTRIALTISALSLPVIGFFPRTVAEKLMQAGLSLTGGESLAAMHYFSPENLKGVLISLIIGTTVYFLFVRKVLFRQGRYREILPSWLNLENSFYLPVLRFAAKGFHILAKMICDSMDGFLLLLRRTLLRPVQIKGNRQEYSHFARSVAQRKSYARDEAADRIYTVAEILHRFFNGFAFSLLMACLGICIVLIVLILKLG